MSNTLREYRYLDMVMATFVTVLLLSNIASAAKIIDWGMSIAGLRLSFDAGTLLFPLSYVFGDVLTEVYGYSRTRRVIWTGCALSLLMAIVFRIIQILPGEAGWQTYAGDAAFDSILGSVSSGGIVLASLLAFVIGEFGNSFVLAKMKVRMRGRFLWMRTIGSTVIGQALDTVTFISIASALGVFPWAIAINLIIANYLFKVGIEIFLTPITYRIVSFLKRTEQEDFFDRDTNFSPFKIHR